MNRISAWASTRAGLSESQELLPVQRGAGGVYICNEPRQGSPRHGTPGSGAVDTKSGSEGGYTIARKAEDITLAEVADALDTRRFRQAGRAEIR